MTENASKTHHEVKILAILTIIFAGFGVLLTFLFLAFRGQIKVLAKKCTFFIILACCIVAVILACVLFGLYIHNHNHPDYEKSTNHYKNLEKHKCIGLEPFQRAIHDVNEYGGQTWKNLSMLVIFFFAISCAFVLFMIISILVRKSKKLEVFPDPRF